MAESFRSLFVLAAGALLVPLVGLAIYVVAIQLISETRIRKRAHRDYEAARGTKHLRTLRSSLKPLRRRLRTRRSQVSGLKQNLEALEEARSAELRVALSAHLVRTRLAEVRGVGPGLSERILRSCFEGSLTDLHSAHHVRGVGASRREAIVAWARARQKEFPLLLAGDFPGKQEILETYKPQVTPLRKALGAERQALTDEEMMLSKAEEAAARLSKIKRSRFRAALRGGRRPASVPAWYLAGVYAPWHQAPEWFSRLTSEFRS
jgi:hypothetical protein